MKFLLILGLLLANNALFGQISDVNANKLANIIYKIEGGANTKYPYGIKSIKTSNPRQVCINTIKNTYVRWQNRGKTNEFLFFLADRYCPPSCDKQGNLNWKKNINKMVDAETKKMFNR